MCGILGLYSNVSHKNLKTKINNLSKILRHRGPDWNGMYISPDNKIALAHERLSIVDVNTGNQPLYSADKGIVLICNGEIYNHIQIRGKFNYNYQTDSDCEVIIPLYIKYGEECVNYLDGIFSFMLYDIKNNIIIVGRDRIGINPLYYGKDITPNTYWFASEFKAITHECDKNQTILDFPPGFIWSSLKAGTSNAFEKGLIQYYQPVWFSENVSSLIYSDLNEIKTCKIIKDTLIDSVKKRLMCDVPYGVLLSGGLDSSLMAAITKKYSNGMLDNHWSSNLHTFSVGLKGSPDLKYAKEVANFLKTTHHEFHFTIEDGINAIRDVIFHTETYDITTIRASTPMYLMSRLIKAHGIKMVISGEGSDELFGGYLYFHKAPNSREFHKECCRKVKDLHKFDCLRANKSTMAWGVEARVPFLDSRFVDIVMNLNPKYKYCKDADGKQRIEKYILRKAFYEKEPGDKWLPDNILWRQKEQFGDGVGYSWIDSIKEYAETLVTNIEMDNASEVFKYNTPETKEAYLYRKIFEEIYPERNQTIKEWIPQIGWGDVSKDPSGRVQNAHNPNIHIDYEDNNKDTCLEPEPLHVMKIESSEYKNIKLDKSTNKSNANNKNKINIKKNIDTHERCLSFMA